MYWRKIWRWKRWCSNIAWIWLIIVIVVMLSFFRGTADINSIYLQWRWCLYITNIIYWFFDERYIIWQRNDELFDSNKMEIVRDKGIITLTDNAGNRFTFKDIIYVSENSDQILFLMKLWYEYQIDFHFIVIEKFIISLSNDIFFIKKSINNIYYI